MAIAETGASELLGEHAGGGGGGADSPPNDAPPPSYWEVVGDGPGGCDRPQDAHNGASPPYPKTAPTGMEVSQPAPGEVRFVKALTAMRPLYIHAEKVASSSLIVERDPNAGSRDLVVVRVEFSGGETDIWGKCKVTMEPNDKDEYEIHAAGKRVGWGTPTLRCRFVVLVSPAAEVRHPGIRAKLCNGHAGLGDLQNADFDIIEIGATNTSVLLSHINGGSIRVKTDGGEIEARNVTAQNIVSLRTRGARVLMRKVCSPQLHAATTDALVSLRRSFGEEVDIRTTNARVSCVESNAGSLRIKAKGTLISVAGSTAQTMRLATTDAPIVGKWRVENLLEASTTSKEIEGRVELVDPSGQAAISLATTNAPIRVALPDGVFCGQLDLKTVAGVVGIGRARNSSGSPLPLYLSLDTEPHKRGMLGTGSDIQHSLTARTTGQNIQVRFVDPKAVRPAQSSPRS
ncbi:hypothetical protein H4R18_004659 [Coemansia javaensis]|uniref:Adhesin domain-containing protein n=1 Tax=Coemansia javaensis TaxID=2761396 RepID=A0A9W8H3P2_9FUNG|nr:hypothetical protein H4R18_004659 [Coemansia javaensis]